MESIRSLPASNPGGPRPRVLGQLLLSDGAITRDALEVALTEQRTTRERLGEVLVRFGADPEVIARSLATQLRLDYSPPPIRSDSVALGLVNAKLAARLRVIPVTADQRRLRVAMADPLDADAIDDLQFQTGRRVDPLVASAHSVEAALAAYHPGEVEAIVGRMRGPGTGGRRQPGSRPRSPNSGAHRRPHPSSPSSISCSSVPFGPAPATCTSNRPAARCASAPESMA